MFNHFIKSIIASIKKNTFFHSINLFGFFIGFLLFSIIITFVYQELSFDKFHKNTNRIYRIHSGGYGVTPPCFAEKLKNKVPEINNIIRFNSTTLNIIHNQDEIPISNTYYTDAEIFSVFSFKLLYGNSNGVLRKPYSIVISKSIATLLFDTDNAIGEKIQNKNGTEYTITGIMDNIPYNSHIQANALISMETLRVLSNDEEFNCGTWSLLTYVELSGNANRNNTEQKINTILEDSKMGTDDGKFYLKLQPLKKIYFDFKNNKYDGCKHGNNKTVGLYFAISCLILLIVILNYINLSTLIASERIKEIAIRKINGAKPIHIITQTLLESFTTILISFLLTIVVVQLLLPQLGGLLNISLSHSIKPANLYFYYFIFLLVIALITGIMPGIILSKITETKALKKESFSNNRGLHRKILLTCQLIIVSVFLGSTLITNKQINYILNKDLGFEYTQVVSFNLSDTLLNKKDLLKAKLLKNPDIKAISYSNNIIASGLAKAPMKYGDKSKLCYFYSVDPDYIDLYKMSIKEGRNFSWSMPTDFENSCIINEKACKEFEISKPIGKKFNNRIIIGLIRDFNFTSLHNQIEPLVINCDYNGQVIQIKIGTSDIDKTKQFIAKTCTSISPPFDPKFSFLNNQINDLYKPELALKKSLKVYTIISFSIALLGLFGLFVYMMNKRTKEVGIRKLFGAKLIDTFKLLIKEQIVIVTSSTLIASPITYIIMNYWLSSFHNKIEIGIFIFLEILIIMFVFTIVAVLVLIIKTHRLNLIKTLKYE